MDNLWDLIFAEVALWTPKVIGALAILFVFYLLSKLIRKIILTTAEKLKFDASLSSLLARISNITFIVLGLITALGTLGVNVSALVAGLGLTGFALGFALKDTISNFLSGILILLYRPFKIGNHIKISGYEGTVISIDLRYTQLDSNGYRVLIPNSRLFTDPVTVMNADEDQL
ncbi:hypothetical protein MNBD_GAMMA11-1552 [hydrothermal vent metagenome]|uniref:Small-conductance mechanosensitive channel n=1 Tax=hydrothermal vent metagenome TaxID=652676 RepID=A0A3B0Y472_9ZZZZ